MMTYTEPDTWWVISPCLLPLSVCLPGTLNIKDSCFILWPLSSTRALHKKARFDLLDNNQINSSMEHVQVGIQTQTRFSVIGMNISPSISRN